MSHEELIAYGCEFKIAEDDFGDTQSGYWLGGQFIGGTPEAATAAIVG